MRLRSLTPFAVALTALLVVPACSKEADKTFSKRDIMIELTKVGVSVDAAKCAAGPIEKLGFDAHDLDESGRPATPRGKQALEIVTRCLTESSGSASTTTVAGTGGGSGTGGG